MTGGTVTLCSYAPAEGSPPPPTETRRWGTIASDDYISKRWLPGPQEGLLGCRSGRGFTTIYISKGQNLQYVQLPVKKKCSKKREVRGLESGRSLCLWFQRVENIRVLMVNQQTNVLTTSGSVHYLHCRRMHDKVFQWLPKRDPRTGIDVLLRSGLKDLK